MPLEILCLPIIYELPFPLPLPRVQFVSAIVASLHWCGFHIIAWESRGYKKIVVSSEFVVGYSNPFTAFVCNVVVNQGTALRKSLLTISQENELYNTVYQTGL